MYYAFAVLGMELFAFRVTRCVDAAQMPVQCSAIDKATGEPYQVDNSSTPDAAALFCLKRGLIDVDNGNRSTLARSCNLVVQQTSYATANYWYMHFNDLGSSMIVLFQLTVVNNWPMIEEGHLAATSQFHRLCVCRCDSSLLSRVHVSLPARVPLSLLSLVVVCQPDTSWPSGSRWS